MPRYKPDFFTRSRFWFDNTLNKGPLAQIFWLGIFSFLVVILAATFITVLQIDPEEKNMSFVEALWVSLMRTLDPGNLNGDNGWSFRLVMLLVTSVGLLIVSTLIGIINSGISRSLEDLRKGKSFVPAKDHIIILGWSSLIFSLLKRLSVSNKFGKKMYIVILADKDKIEMEDEIRTKIKSSSNVKIVCRNGSPLDINDLELVNPHEAHTILVLSPEEDKHDVYAVKTVMSLVRSHNRKLEKYRIVVEIKDKANEEIVKAISEDEVLPVVSDDLFSLMTVQSSLQSGLSEVYNEILDLNEFHIIYFQNELFTGKSFLEIIIHCKNGSPIGIRDVDGKIALNPPKDRILLAEEKLVVLHDSCLMPTWERSINVDINRISENKVNLQKPQFTLILGWNSKSNGIIEELDKNFISGSEVLVVADIESLELEIESISKKLKNQKISFQHGNIRNRATLESLNLKHFNHVILLCYDQMDIQSADAITLVTLLHLRHLIDRTKCNFTIVSEILDIRNRSLAEVTRADDYIVSDRLIGMVMAQLAGNIELNKIFTDLLTPGGPDIFLRPVEEYIVLGEAVTVATLVESAARKGYTFLGYRLAQFSDDPKQKYGIVLNPDKSKKVNFSARDRIIIVHST